MILYDRYKCMTDLSSLNDIIPTSVSLVARAVQRKCYDVVVQSTLRILWKLRNAISFTLQIAEK